MATKGNDNLLPTGASPVEGGDEVDLSNLRVNFSDKEATSEAFDLDPVPSGKYPVAITDIEVRKSTSEKNPGKPYWSVEMTVQDGNKYAGRKFWGNVMLFEGALFSLSQLLKATGIADRVEEGSKTYGKIPSGDELLGKQLTITVVKTRDNYREKEQGDPSVKLFKNEVKGYMGAGAVVGSAASGGDSLLPG
jgi:hypothetical protein